MKFLIQRVDKAAVSVENQIAGEIETGLLVLIGICDTDTVEIADKMISKLINLRIFEDENGKTNLDIKQVNGELLIISQFTLYADCRKGNRPSFIKAGNPEKAETMYEYVLTQCAKEIPHVARGVFGAHMKVSLVNNGPFTVILDSDELCH